MKNFRKTALVLATATSVAFAGTSVAGAQTTTDGSSNAGNTSLSSESTNTGDATGSSNFLWKVGEVLGAHETDAAETGADIWGSTQGVDVSPWAQVFKWGWIIAVTGAVAGLGIGIANELKNRGIII